MVGFDANETVCFCFFQFFLEIDANETVCFCLLLIVYKLFIITSDDDYFMYN